MAECDVDALMAEAGCLGCYSEKQLLIIQAQLLCNVATAFEPTNFVPNNDPGETFTEGSVLFIGNNGGATEDNPNFFYNDTANTLQIGTRGGYTIALNENSLGVFRETSVDTSGSNFVGYFEANVTAGTNATIGALTGIARATGGTTATLSAVNSTASLGGGTVTNAYGLTGSVVGLGANTTNVYGLSNVLIFVAGTHTNIYGIDTSVTMSAAFTECWGDRIVVSGTGTGTNIYGQFVELGGTHTISGRRVVQWLMSNNANAIGQVINAATGQVANLQDWRVNNVNLASMTAAGLLQSQGVQIVSTGTLAFSSGAIGAASDVILQREAANVLAMYNSTTAQTFRIYATRTDGTTYNRLSITGNTIQTEASTSGPQNLTLGAAGSGGSAAINLATGGTNRWQINASGHLLCVANNTYDIGATGASSPRTIYVGTSIQVEANNGYKATNQVSGAGGSLGSLTNAPSAGNPDFWMPITINGTAHWIPAWAA